MPAMWTQWDALLYFSDGSKTQVRPFFLILEITDKVIHVQPLHDNNDRILRLIVEARKQRIAKPLRHIFACKFRMSVLRFERIIQNNEIAPAASERTPNRCS